MDNIAKLRILLQHWIDHNGGHVAEFAKWRQTMAEDKQDSVVEALELSMQQMNTVSETLRRALDELGGPDEAGAHHHHHGHHHH